MKTVTHDLKATYSPDLDQYAGKVLFAEKLNKANEIMARVGTPALPIPKQQSDRRAAVELCEALKQHRLRHHLTQTQLADRVGMQKEFISRIENGRVDVQLSTFLKIVDGLGLRMMVTE